MSLVFMCDVCGVHIETTKSLDHAMSITWFNKQGQHDGEYELCRKCTLKMEKFIKTIKDN